MLTRICAFLGFFFLSMQYPSPIFGASQQSSNIEKMYISPSQIQLNSAGIFYINEVGQLAKAKGLFHDDRGIYFIKNATRQDLYELVNIQIQSDSSSKLRKKYIDQSSLRIGSSGIYLLASDGRAVHLNNIFSDNKGLYILASNVQCPNCRLKTYSTKDGCCFNMTCRLYCH